MSELLEREFEKLHGIKWADAAFSVRACWTDAWLTATAREREACAKVCENSVYSLTIDDWNGMTKKEHGAHAGRVCAEQIRMRSNA